MKCLKIYFTQDYEENVAGCMLTKPAELCTYGYWHILKAILDFVGIFAASFLVGYQFINENDNDNENDVDDNENDDRLGQ